MLLALIFTMMLMMRTVRPFKAIARLQRTKLSAAAPRSPSPNSLTSPTDFGEKFSVPPIPTSRLSLQKKNPCALDEKITFDEKTHTYTLNGKPVKYSVTQIIEEFFEKFDGPVVVKKMMNGNNWPRPEYMTRDNSRPLTEEEILDKWDKIGLYARNRGEPFRLLIYRRINICIPQEHGCIITSKDT